MKKTVIDALVAVCPTIQHSDALLIEHFFNAIREPGKVTIDTTEKWDLCEMKTYIATETHDLSETEPTLRLMYPQPPYDRGYSNMVLFPNHKKAFIAMRTEVTKILFSGTLQEIKDWLLSEDKEAQNA